MAPEIGVSAVRMTTPLHTPFVTALRRATTLSSVVVKVTDIDGHVGYGEAPQVWRVTGESVPGITSCVLGPLADVLKRWDVDQPLEMLSHELDASVVGNSGAKAACEVAASDLVARRRKMPLHRLLGSTATRVATDMTIAADALPESTPARLREGFRHLKVKVGVDADDINRVRRVHEATEGRARIRIDANQGWDFDTAVTAIQSWLNAGVDLEFVEQPLSRWDLDGHARLRRAVPVPIMLDESVFSIIDLYRALDANSADMVNIKLAKCGGLHAGLELAQEARLAGLDVMVGSMLESRVGVSAAAALAANVSPESVHDIDAAWWSIDLAQDASTPYKNGTFLLDESPGLSRDTLGLDAVTGWER